MKRIVLIRQRPSIGDCLLLGPLIGEIKRRHPDSNLTVITDPLYLGGALVTTFKGIPGIDRIEEIPSTEWTTLDNKRIDQRLIGASDELPLTVRRASMVFDCNSAFIDYERKCGQNLEYGIAEFWLRHYSVYHQGMDMRPRYNVSPEARNATCEWLHANGLDLSKPLVGIVLRAGDNARDWDFGDRSKIIADWLHTRGCIPIGIDPFKPLQSSYAKSFVGKRLDHVAALLEHCTAVLTPDTGILHLAQAVGTTTVALWGILDPKLRVAGYRDTVVVPQKSLGYCAADDRACQCHWKAQQWSCLRRLNIHHITDALSYVLDNHHAKPGPLPERSPL